MSRPVVQLHTIEQWLQLDRSGRNLIIQHIRLKDRLEKWIEAKYNNPHPHIDTPEWRPCARCKGSQYPGYVLKEPRAPGIHPSQLGSSCLLKIYWEMEGKAQQEHRDARLYLIFDVGSAIHRMMQDYGQQGAWGDRYWPESRITASKHPLADGLFIEGSADAENILTIDTIPNAPIYEVGLVHEYKSIKKENFAKLTRPKPEHKQQAIVYAKVLNRPIVVYLYFCKNDSAMVDFPVEFDPEAWYPIQEKAELLVDHFDRGEAPPATTGYHCNECPFIYNCPAGRAARQAAVARR